MISPGNQPLTRRATRTLSAKTIDCGEPLAGERRIVRRTIVIEEPDHPILPRPWTYDLVQVDWRSTPAIAEGWLDLKFQKGAEQRRLRFLAPTEVQVDRGFMGQPTGLRIVDIRSRGWDRVGIEVLNFEQDPGITFFAADVVDLDEVEDA